MMHESGWEMGLGDWECFSFSFWVGLGWVGSVRFGLVCLSFVVGWG